MPNMQQSRRSQRSRRELRIKNENIRNAILDAMDRNNTDFIPGTDVIFVDQGDSPNPDRNDVVLIPQPSSSPDDPLVSSLFFQLPHLSGFKMEIVNRNLELESEMEGHHHPEPAHFRLCQYDDAVGHLSLDASLRDRVQQVVDRSQHTVRRGSHHPRVRQHLHRTCSQLVWAPPCHTCLRLDLRSRQYMAGSCHQLRESRRRPRHRRHRCRSQREYHADGDI